MEVSVLVGLATEEDRGICCTPFHRLRLRLRLLRSFSINKLRQEQCKFNVVKLSYHAEICACYPLPHSPLSLLLNKQCSPRGQRQCCWGCSHMSNRSRRNTTRGGSTAPPPPPSHADLLIFLYAYIYIYVYVFCMRGAWLTYFKIMPASNKGKKRVQISVCFRSFRSCQRRVSTRGGQGRTPARCI